MRANRCAVGKTLRKTENAGGYAGTPMQSPPAHPERHALKKERQIVCKRQAKGNASTQLFAGLALQLFVACAPLLPQ